MGEDESGGFARLASPGGGPRLQAEPSGHRLPLSALGSDGLERPRVPAEVEFAGFQTEKAHFLLWYIDLTSYAGRGPQDSTHPLNSPKVSGKGPWRLGVP